MATKFMTMSDCIKEIGVPTLDLVRVFTEKELDGVKTRTQTEWLKCWCADTKPAPTMVLVPADVAKAVAMAMKAKQPLVDLFLRTTTEVAEESGEKYTKTLILRKQEAEFSFSAE